MGGKRRKIGELGKVDWGTAFDSPEFGGSGRSMRRRSSGGEPPRSRSERPSRPPCDDCDGTAKCLHCKDGFYPRRDGSNAPCGKCRGSLTCHACRGRGTGGHRCSTPRYEEAFARLQKEWARKIANGVITAALGVVEIAAPGLSGGALPGQQSEVGDLAKGWKDSARMEQRDQQTRGLRRSTRDKGTRDRGSGQR